MKRWFSVLVLAMLTFSVLTPRPASATTLSVSLWCGRDYVSHYCTAYPSGGSGGYTYEWRWYGTGNSYSSGPNITVFPAPGCTGSSAIVVIVRDSAGASASAYTYLAC
jgi:hypothetical protein